VRGYLGLDLKEQASWRSAHVAVKRWRERVEDVGLFVFKRPMKQKDISGFCLLDDEFPVICLNNSTPHTRQAFSLFHELAHVLLGTNGVTKRDDSYIKLLSPRFGSIEVFCNRFAAEFLLPSEAFSAFLGEDFHNDSIVRTIAEKFHVSREVVLRRALDAGLVDAEHYQQKASEWASQADLARRSRPGGDYYASQATYLGSRFLQLAFSRYYQGRCTREQLAEHLNVKVDTLTGLETFATVGGHH
jgi:Zn-dependent peptidase ImmA (M78 family)